MELTTNTSCSNCSRSDYINCPNSSAKPFYTICYSTHCKRGSFRSTRNLQKKSTYTHAILSFPPSFLAVNHHNNKNWVLSILTHNLWIIYMGMKQKKKSKKNSKWLTQKNWVFQLRQFSIFFCENFMDLFLG